MQKLQSLDNVFDCKAVNRSKSYNLNMDIYITTNK